jgi:hypothetical protein
VAELRTPTGHNINRVLLANAAVLLAVLASYPAFALLGEWSGATAGYVIISAGLFVLCLLALAVSRYIDAVAGLVFYAWCGFSAIAGMMMLDVINGAAEFPWVLYLLILGVFCLGHFRVDFHRRIFTAATLLIVVIAGAIYRQYDQAIACAATASLIALIHGGNDDGDR